MVVIKDGRGVVDTSPINGVRGNAVGLGVVNPMGGDTGILSVEIATQRCKGSPVVPGGQIQMGR